MTVQTATHFAGVAKARIDSLLAAERARFAAARPRSQALAADSRKHWWNGVPLHWMLDWGTPFPLFVATAQGATLTDVDGNSYVDFCLGDTGAMFGHSPPPVVAAIQQQAAQGLTAMLPSADAPEAGRLLAEIFGLPFWQMTATASDANRSVLRWARAITGRPKILVFQGCYHGQVDETSADMGGNGQTVPRPSLVGQALDLEASTVVVEFNDIPALKAALAQADIACVLAEPALTNCSMVLPDSGYHTALRELTRKHGSLLAIDETHSVSTALGGYTRAHRLDPDFFVVGKAVAGGLPCGVYGFTQAVAQQMEAVNRRRPPGHSGMGTTLSGNPLALAALRANLGQVMTHANYQHMLGLAQLMATQLTAAIQRHALPWHVVHLGARAEFVFTPEPLRNGSEAMALPHGALEQAVHLYLLNRGVLVTPFHNMLLASPATTPDDVARLGEAFDACLAALTA